MDRLFSLLPSIDSGVGVALGIIASLYVAGRYVLKDAKNTFFFLKRKKPSFLRRIKLILLWITDSFIKQVKIEISYADFLIEKKNYPFIKPILITKAYENENTKRSLDKVESDLVGYFKDIGLEVEESEEGLRIKALSKKWYSKKSFRKKDLPISFLVNINEALGEKGKSNVLNFVEKHKAFFFLKKGSKVHGIIYTNSFGSTGIIKALKRTLEENRDLDKYRLSKSREARFHQIRNEAKESSLAKIPKKYRKKLRPVQQKFRVSNNHFYIINESLGVSGYTYKIEKKSLSAELSSSFSDYEKNHIKSIEHEFNRIFSIFLLKIERKPFLNSVDNNFFD